MEQQQLVLYGMWASPYCLEIEVALTLKGIAYEYKEENLNDKSDSLLKFNPIYQKVPVLVCNGKPVAESLVILEYIEETWKLNTPLLPSDPYQKARVRFWTKFLDEKFASPCRSIIVTEGEQQQRGIRETKEQLMTFEEGTRKDFPSETTFYNGDAPGLLDIVVGSMSSWIRILGEMTGIELVSEGTTPVLSRRLRAFEEIVVVKEKQPQRDRLKAYALNIRKKFVG